MYRAPEEALVKHFFLRTSCLRRAFLTNRMVFIHSGFQEASGVVSRLKDGKRYLSTDYKLHISNETPCVDHCSVYALSSNEAEYRGTCSHQHNIGCDRCNDLRDAVVDIQVALSEIQLRYYFLDSY